MTHDHGPAGHPGRFSGYREGLAVATGQGRGVGRIGPGRTPGVTCWSNGTFAGRGKGMVSVHRVRRDPGSSGDGPDAVKHACATLFVHPGTHGQGLRAGDPQPVVARGCRDGTGCRGRGRLCR